MEKAKIVNSLKLYFKSPLTDYAVMVTGEWGVGKTYFLSKEVVPIIEKLKLRPIYISLIGLFEDAQLEKLIFQKIDPFYKSTNKSSVSIEADFIESIISGKDKSKLNIPNDIVLCFDDLERINPNFFESAIGLINIFIEHSKTKCIFLCNEDKLLNSNDFPSYKITKEKYFRYTYSFIPEFSEVLHAKVSEIETEHQQYYDSSIIVEMFKRGKSYNLRTLFFSLSIFEQCLVEFDKLPDTLTHKKDIIKLALTYCCFYTIETKKGTPHELLEKITFARKQNFLLPNLVDIDFKDKLDIDTENKGKINLNYDSEMLENIQQRYFIDNSIEFERFESIAGLIKGGYLNSESFEQEIKALSKILEKKKKGENETQLVYMLDNVFKYSDIELHEKIGWLINEVKKGSINLAGYLRLYQNLVWLESFRIKGVVVNDSVTKSFMDGVEKAFQSGELEYIQNLKFQSQWSQNDKSEYAKKYSEFADYVISINEKLYGDKESKSFKDVLTAIIENNDTELVSLLSKETRLRLNKKNAIDIYNALIQSIPHTTNSFDTSLQVRYSNEGNIISQMPKIEEDFILTLYDLLSKNKNLNLEAEKSLNDVALKFLKNNLKNLIENHFPKNKQIKNEE